jgi:two-component system response regulator YesN
MNILVVEDEFETRKGILSQLDKLEASVLLYEADNGARALAIMEQNTIDIVLTDIRMPEIDGLQLLKIVRIRFPSTVVIMLSAHSDFTYAQTALSLGATDYLLKPIGALEIDQVIMKAISKIQKANEKQFYIERNQRIAIQNALRDMMNQVPIYYANYELQMKLEQTGFVLLHMSAQRRNEMLADKLFWYSVQNIFEEIFAPFIPEKPYFISNFLGLFVVLPLCEGQIQALDSPISILQSEVENVLKANLHFWQSQPYNSLNQLSQSYQNFLLKYYRPMDKGLETKTENILALSVSIKALDYEQSSRQLSDLLLHPEVVLEHAKEIAYEVTLLLTKEIDILDTTVKIQLKRKLLSFKAIKEMDSKNEILEAFQEWIKQLIKQLQNQVQGERHYAIQKVIGYIKDHLAADFTLKDIADQIYLNESYLSTLFKNEMGETFSEYVLKLRMKRASELLLSSAIPIQEISPLVGYPNYGYFSQVFRRFYGKSPSNFRKRGMIG